MTRPSHGAQLLVNHMSNSRFFLRRAYHFFEFTSLSTRFSNIDSASIFFNSAFSFSNSLSRFASIALAKNTDNLVRAMSFTFHERSSWELRNTHNKNGANSEGHARCI
jgi:hypothetical protein